MDNNPIKNYFGQLRRILTHPKIFFRELPVHGPITGALVFALVTQWIGSALSFLWHSATGDAVGGYVKGLFRMADGYGIDSAGRGSSFLNSPMLLEVREHLLHWMWGTGSVILSPFLTIASIFFTSCIVYIGARIFVTPGKNGAPSEINFESAVRLMCYGMAPAILAGIPFIGGIASGFLIAIITIIAMKEFYRISTSRAVAVALFPKILFFGTIAVGILLILLGFFKFFVTSF